MKRIYLLMAFAAITLIACDKKEPQPIENAVVSFDYRSVVNDYYENQKVEFRNTSDPSELKAYIWKFPGYADAIGEDPHHFFTSTGEQMVILRCKDSNGFVYTDTFSIKITGSCDSVWTAAIPK